MDFFPRNFFLLHKNKREIKFKLLNNTRVVLITNSNKKKEQEHANLKLTKKMKI